MHFSDKLINFQTFLLEAAAQICNQIYTTAYVFSNQLYYLQHDSHSLQMLLVDLKKTLQPSVILDTTPSPYGY